MNQVPILSVQHANSPDRETERERETQSESFLRQSRKRSKAKFIEKPLDELETMYDKQWLQEKVVKCRHLRFLVCFPYQLSCQTNHEDIFPQNMSHGKARLVVPTRRTVLLPRFWLLIDPSFHMGICSDSDVEQDA